MDFISVFAHSFSSVSAKTTCQAPAGFNLFFFFALITAPAEHMATAQRSSSRYLLTLWQTPVYISLPRANGWPCESNLARTAQWILFPLMASLASCQSGRNWRCCRLKDGDHRSKHRFFSRRCQGKLQHRTSQRQFISPRPEPFWRTWWRQLSLGLGCALSAVRGGEATTEAGLCLCYFTPSRRQQAHEDSSWMVPRERSSGKPDASMGK